jgi:hypothetical protein
MIKVESNLIKKAPDKASVTASEARKPVGCFS